MPIHAFPCKSTLELNVVRERHQMAVKIPSTSVSSYKSALTPAATIEPVISEPPREKVQI